MKIERKATIIINIPGKELTEKGIIEFRSAYNTGTEKVGVRIHIH